VTGPVEWEEQPIGWQHDRKGFDCGSRDLNEYLERYARQNHESGGAKTFVAVSPGDPTCVLRRGARYANARAARWVTQLVATTRCSWLAGRFFSGFVFAQGLAVEGDAMRVVDDAIEDRIGECWLGEVLVPVRHRELAGDDGRASGGAIVEYFEQIGALGLSDRGKREVVD